MANENNCYIGDPFPNNSVAPLTVGGCWIGDYTDGGIAGRITTSTVTLPKPWKFCPECAQKLEAGWKFCAGCGDRLNVAMPQWWHNASLYPFIGNQAITYPILKADIQDAPSLSSVDIPSWEKWRREQAVKV